jgi:hypothetical protein
MNVARADERPHDPPPAPGPLWEESWDLTFATADAAFGGFVRLTLRPADQIAWWWTGLAGAGRPYALVRDADVELPPGSALEVRASGLWAEITEETPDEHWSFGLEAFGVAFEDPADAWGDEMGERVAVGLDLEWERVEAAGAMTLPGGAADLSAQPGVVHGEVLVGSERIELDAFGWRRHARGERDWWGNGARPWWFGGHFADGTPVAGWDAGDDDQRRKLPPLAVVALAPVLVTGRGGEVAHLERALCRFDTENPARPAGGGWAEVLKP